MKCRKENAAAEHAAETENVEESRTSKRQKRRHFRPFPILRLLRTITRTMLIFSLGVFVGVHRKVLFRAFLRKKLPVTAQLTRGVFGRKKKKKTRCFFL